jgi:soluble lytic murein transglycosylase-like protein
MTRRLSLALLLSVASLLPAAPISRATLAAVLDIGDAAGVPRSVVVALMREESGGDAAAVSRTVGGYRSIGLFQLYARPADMAWKLSRFWTEQLADFDVWDPLDNATVALRFLAWAHERYGNWLQALYYYNHGDIQHVPEATREYARRIVNYHYEDEK